jgi:predicted esterase
VRSIAVRLSCLAVMAFFALASFAQSPQPNTQLRIMNTTQGDRFAVIGRSVPTPAPLVLLFDWSIEETLADPGVPRIEEQLKKDGAIFVTMDLPSHGLGQPKGERNPLHDWRVRIEHGDNFVVSFEASVSRIVNYLVEQGLVDPKRIGAVGDSRGGFLAFHFAAEDSRVCCVLTFSPVTDLLTLREFEDMDTNTLAHALSVQNSAGALAGRHILILIGSTDYRVGTRRAISLFERLTEGALAKGLPPAAELRVSTARGHNLDSEQYTAGGAWLATFLAK